MLVALKKAIITNRESEKTWPFNNKKLQRPPKNMDLEDWLISWQVVFEQYKEANLAEVSNNCPLSIY